MSLSVCAQENQRRNFFPLWTYHQRNINIHGVSLGLWRIHNTPRNTYTNGIKLELIGVGLAMPLIPRSPIADDDSSYASFFNEPLSERINGIAISASGAACHCEINGITLGGVGQILTEVNGVSASFLMNIVQKQSGLMISITNDTYVMNGVQIGLGNAAKKMKGIQFGGLHNDAEDIKGIQIAATNRAGKLKGVQIGLWNVNQKRKWPIINWNFSD